MKKTEVTLVATFEVDEDYVSIKGSQYDPLFDILDEFETRGYPIQFSLTAPESEDEVEDEFEDWDDYGEDPEDDDW